jgi:uncharacterized protein YbaP (TraB family)
MRRQLLHFFCLALCFLARAGAEELPAYVLGAEKFGDGRFWLVTKDGGSPSYVLGTIHVADPKLTELSLAERRAIESARVVVTEIALDMATALAAAQRMFAPDGPGLDKQVEAARYRKLVKILRERGVPEPLARRLKPWAALVTAAMPKPDGVPFDAQLYEGARQRGQTVAGLETVDEQIGVLDSIPIDEQIQLLDEAIDHFDVIEGMINKMMRVYAGGNLSELLLLQANDGIERDAAARRRNEAFLDALLIKRNRRMADRMQAHFGQGNAFVAIGALHLPGEFGVLNLLKRAGYQIERGN